MSEDRELIRALLSLLDDEDESVVKTAEKKLLEMGRNIVPELKNNIDDQPLRTKVRVRGILHRITADSLEEDFRRLPEDEEGRVDLEEGLFTLARIGYPDLHPEPYRGEIKRIAELIREELDRWDTLDPHTTVESVNQVLFDQMGFEGNEENYYEPDNSFLNQVLTRRTGIPISLSSLVLLVGERLDLPFSGVGMPAHFIVSYPNGDERILMDPFNGGKLLSRKNCAKFLIQSGFGYVDEYLQPVSNREILLRYLRNLINVYRREQSLDRVEEIRSYLAIVEHHY